MEINTEEFNKICKKAIIKWGEQKEILMVFEEMAELQFHLAKYLRYTPKKGTHGFNDRRFSIAEEIADLEIMLHQMKLIFWIEDEVQDYRYRKILRLKERLEKK